MTDEGGQESLSPYHFSYNNPMRFNDPDGKFPDGCCSLSDIVSTVKDVVSVTSTAVLGAVNAWSSNQIGGAGRVDVDQMGGLTDGQRTAAVVGQAVGDVVSMVTGAAEIVVAGTGEIASFGGASPLAIPVAVHGASSIAMGAVNLIKGSNKPSHPKESSSPKSPANKETKKDYGKAGGSEHSNNARKSTKQTHESGQARKQQDRQGSKGMVDPPRRRPENWKGPWPPKK